MNLKDKKTVIHTKYNKIYHVILRYDMQMIFYLNLLKTSLESTL